jgi:hypothetical protein
MYQTISDEAVRGLMKELAEFVGPDTMETENATSSMLMVAGGSQRAIICKAFIIPQINGLHHPAFDE